ncbi:MAG TPA: cupin domain-containing protein [Verrucomicrobiae bacterium]|nr:cupin domain-containing protein [Verrucomicrobiae bacterium]
MSKPAPTDQLWFLDSLVTIRVPASAGQDGLSVLEHRMPHGSSAPLHFHRTEDELLQILEGEYRVKVRDQEQRVGVGAILLIPKGTPHTYRVESAQGRLLSITVGGEFERFVCALSRPAERPEPPPPAGQPSDDVIQEFKGTAAKFGIEIIGPPLR